MKRYLIWISIVIAAILSGIIIYAALKDDEEVVLVSAVKVMNGRDSCVSVVGEISATAYYGDMYLDNREKKELLISLAKDMGIREEFEFGAAWENGRDMVYLCKKGASSEFKLSMNTIETAAAAAASAVSASAVAGHTEKTYAQYIVCRLNITDSPESVCHYAELITDVIEKRGLYCDLTLTFISSYDGEFGSEERNVLTDDILKSLGARVVAENRSKELFSVYAYTDFDMIKAIALGNDKINLNIAINYNEAAAQTRVYLAAPIIDMEY